MTSRFRHITPALLFVLPVIFFDRICLAGESFYLRDLFNWFYPWRVFAADSLARLDFPLWNPYSYAGTPFLANMQSGLLYPPNVVFWLFDFPTAMRLFVVIQFGLAGWFMYLLLRTLSCRIASSLTGALGYAYGGWMLSHIEFPNKLAAAAWLPLIMLGVVLFRNDRKITGLIVGSIATTCCITAGYPQTTFLILIGVGIVWCADLLRQIMRREEPRRLLTTAVSLPAICFLGALLSAVQIVPFLEAVSRSSYRAGFEPARALAQGMHPLHFLDLLMPHIFGAPGYKRYWGGNLLQFWMGHFYVGLVVVVLAAAALWGARPWRRASFDSYPSSRRDAVYSALTLLLLATLFCMGDKTPVAPFCVAWLPGFIHMRWLSTTSLLIAFPICWLAAMGLDGVLERLEHPADVSRAIRPFVLAVTLVAVVWGGIAIASTELFGALIHGIAGPILEPGQEALIDPNLDLVRSDAMRMAVGAAILTAAWFAAAAGRLRIVVFSALVPVVLFADLKLSSEELNYTAASDVYALTPQIVADLRARPDQPFRIYVPTETLGLDLHMYGSHRREVFIWAKETLLFNLNLPYRIFSASDGDPLRTERSMQFHQKLESSVDDTVGRFLALDNIAVVLAQDAAGQPARTLVPTWMPRVHLSAGARQVPPDNSLAALEEASWNPYLQTIVEDDFPGIPRAGSGTRVDYRVHQLTYTNNTVTVDVESKSPAYLVLADTFYPGWVAQIDGRVTPVFTANYLFRGIDLPSGRHTVRFLYRPSTVAIGALGSMAGLTILAGLMYVRRRDAANLRTPFMKTGAA